MIGKNLITVESLNSRLKFVQLLFSNKIRKLSEIWWNIKLGTGKCGQFEEP